MLVNNCISGILPANIQALDNNRQLWYETTGRVSLKKMFSQNAPGTEEISRLLRQIEEAGRKVEEYLLEADDLVLDLDYIFNTEEGNYSFLYLPDYQVNVGKQLQQLLEGLMEYMDYGNRQAVSLVYLLHARSRQQDGGIFSIRKLCDEILYEEDRERKALEKEEEEKEKEKEKQDYMPSLDARIVQDSCYGSTIKEKEPASARKSWKERLGEKIKGFIGKITEIKEEDEDDILFGKELQETEPQGRGLQGTERFSADSLFGAPSAVAVQETVQLEDRQQDTVFLADSPQETVLLAGSSQDTMPLAEGFQPLSSSVRDKPLYSLEPLTDGEESIPIPSFPFQIGKEKTSCGHAFRDPVISRYHARIQQEQEDYYLVDLASLNGTFLNGERLRPNECRKIAPGDILGFADIFYIFTCST